ncbi:hypothetical protein F4821DRAFT_281107 [Hypoxylon rubiginosum]|uniref:Uncharacterized protein n=1 Tax=Hypoxylon rubiginosum TaxID=110542 RepID=A0ACC0CRK7_9PEZI|nr:hypothetical protein F4821DRAFT_281107 [Hypoxylon rubiginosum]
MDDLPIEVIERIVSFLPDTGLSSFATISSKWQHPVERRTFSCLTITSREADKYTELKALEQYVFSPSRAYRRKYLREIHFRVCFPRLQTNQAHSYVCRTSWRHIQQLFRILALGDHLDATNEGRTGGRKGITLDLGLICIPESGSHLGFIFGNGVVLGNGREQLSQVKCISRLIQPCHIFARVFDRNYRTQWVQSLVPETAIHLVKSLPCLRYLVIDDNHNAFTFLRGPRHFINRDHFIRDLSNANYLSNHQGVATSTPLKVYLNFRPTDNFGGASTDIMSPTLRMWSHNVASFDVSGAFDRSLFWPQESEPTRMLTLPESPWPWLRSFHVKLLNETPSGDPYFATSNASRSQNVPVKDKVQPLFESWAKALAAMPIIEQATVRWSLTFDTPEANSKRDWLVGFQAPGTTLRLNRHAWEHNVTADMRMRPRLVFQNDHGWRPDHMTMKQLHKMGEEKFPMNTMIEVDVDHLGNVTQLQT